MALLVQPYTRTVNNSQRQKHDLKPQFNPKSSWQEVSHQLPLIKFIILFNLIQHFELC